MRRCRASSISARRSLLRSPPQNGLNQAVAQISHLRDFCLHPARLMSLTTERLELAARFWAQARNRGTPTASPHALDVDVIIAAQALSLGLQSTEFVVATTNPEHLSQFVPVELWTNLDVSVVHRDVHRLFLDSPNQIRAAPQGQHDSADGFRRQSPEYPRVPATSPRPTGITPRR